MWRRNLSFACFCLVAVAVVVNYVLPRRKFAGQRSLVFSTEGQSVRRGNSDFDQVVERLNSQYEQHWKKCGLTPAARADKLTLARRMSLGLTGTVPSLEEIRELEQLEQHEFADRWLDYLLQDRRYGDHVAERIARSLVGVEEGPFLIFRRRRFVSWLSDRLMENTPFDQLTREIVASSGLWTDSPGVNFLTVTTNPEIEDRPDPVRLAGRTTRAFLGVRLDCMQCHDDNLEGDWLQSDFHGLAAFYNDPTPTIVGIVDKDRPYEYQYLDEDESQVVVPSVPFNTRLLPADGTPRERLAAWITHPENRPFARATVNRTWAILFGKPLHGPIDDVPLEGPYPPGMEFLADDLIDHSFDLARLFRLIVASDVFQIDSRAAHELTAEHEAAWASFPITRLRPEQMAGALLQSARLNTVDGGSHVLLRLARFGETNDFVRDYGDSGEDEFTPQGGTIPQRLVMMNGFLVQERTKRELLANAATRIARLANNDRSAVATAYLTVLTRHPSSDEVDYFCRQWTDRNELDRPEQLADLCWTLINSSEFAWNH